MTRFACIFVALGLAAAGSTAFAAKPLPVVMTDAEMDDVTAGMLTIVIQDSFNNWTIGAGDDGGTAAAAPLPGNDNAKGWEQGKGNKHAAGGSSSGASTGKHGDTYLFTVNLIANVNTAIAGGDATAIQTVGTSTQSFTVTRR
jgi:hypothetical protein